MDRIQSLQKRKEALEKAGKGVRDAIREVFDESSFVELAAFSFSQSAFYGDAPQGEGVVTGFATIDGYPYYVIAQNFADNFGGLTKANCEKIVNVLNAAEKNETPVVWLLHSQGVRIGEGVEVLEGISQLLLKASQLKGTTLQFAIVCGEVYGACAAIAAISDCVFFLKESSLAITSPLVLSAKSGKNLKKEEVGGFHALSRSGLFAIEVKDLQEASTQIKQLSALIGVPVMDAELNLSTPSFNVCTDAASIKELLEDGIELGSNSSPEVKTIVGRIGGITAAAVIFDNVSLNAQNLRKIRDFAEFASCYSLPFITFVDCVGIEPTLDTNDSNLLREIAEYFNIIDTINTKIAVVTGKAVGLGYSLFAAKSSGFDYTYALATADISLFENSQGAQIFYQNEKTAEKEELLERYREEFSDPINAAKGGYLDNIVEPQFIRQFLIASLQMLLR